MADTGQPIAAANVLSGQGVQEAAPLGDGIFMSRDISNAYRVVTPEGDVIVNTGMGFSEAENVRRLGAVSGNPVRVIVFTQSHADHIGGWAGFDGPEVETIAQANFAYVRDYWLGLAPVYTRRSQYLWGGEITQPIEERPEPVITTSFIDHHAFELGGRRFELYATPGGETLDSLVVWLPQDRIVFTGNLMGPIFGHVPNLYTLRGDKIRSAERFIESVQRVIDLGAETLITGHGEPLRGADEIRRQLVRIRDAVRFIKDRTWEGMNAGVDLWTLMGSIRLPADLALGQGHGKLPWLVRAIWEEHLGWFRYDSSTELYDVPASAVTPDLIELAGGAGPVVERALRHLAQDRPLHALHLAEAVLASEPHQQDALTVKLRASERLLDLSGRENFSEVRWLEKQIGSVKAALEDVI